MLLLLELGVLLTDHFTSTDNISPKVFFLHHVNHVPRTEKHNFACLFPLNILLKARSAWKCIFIYNVRYFFLQLVCGEQ